MWPRLASVGGGSEGGRGIPAEDATAEGASIVVSPLSRPPTPAHLSSVVPILAFLVSVAFAFADSSGIRCCVIGRKVMQILN